MVAKWLLVGDEAHNLVVGTVGAATKRDRGQHVADWMNSTSKSLLKMRLKIKSRLNSLSVLDENA